jgi:hypothetical protein
MLRSFLGHTSFVLEDIVEEVTPRNQLKHQLCRKGVSVCISFSRQRLHSRICVSSQKTSFSWQIFGCLSFSKMVISLANCDPIFRPPTAIADLEILLLLIIFTAYHTPLSL